jgi:hypothetical protein
VTNPRLSKPKKIGQREINVQRFSVTSFKSFEDVVSGFFCFFHFSLRVAGAPTTWSFTGFFDFSSWRIRL